MFCFVRRLQSAYITRLCCSLSEDFSEDLLSAHESELDRTRGFYQDNKDVFEMVEKRQKLWRQQMEMDVCMLYFRGLSFSKFQKTTLCNN